MSRTHRYSSAKALRIWIPDINFLTNGFRSSNRRSPSTEATRSASKSFLDKAASNRSKVIWNRRGRDYLKPFEISRDRLTTLESTNYTVAGRGARLLQKSEESEKNRQNNRSGIVKVDRSRRLVQALFGLVSPKWSFWMCRRSFQKGELIAPFSHLFDKDPPFIGELIWLTWTRLERALTLFINWFFQNYFWSSKSESTNSCDLLRSSKPSRMCVCVCV